LKITPRSVNTAMPTAFPNICVSIPVLLNSSSLETQQISYFLLPHEIL
jgi:hypothetical protein